jgi:hypothetical protein
LPRLFESKCHAQETKGSRELREEDKRRTDEEDKADEPTEFQN